MITLSLQDVQKPRWHLRAGVRLSNGRSFSPLVGTPSTEPNGHFRQDVKEAGTARARTGHEQGTCWVQKQKAAHRGGFLPIRKLLFLIENLWLRGQDLNLRPLGYEPNELPGCSTPRLSLRS